MEKDYLHLLENLKSYRKNRLELAQLAQEDMDFRRFCIDSLKSKKASSIQSRAAWVLDIALEENPSSFLDSIEDFISLKDKHIDGGALRSLMRMLSHLSQFEQKDTSSLFTKKQRQNLVSFAFDSLIGNHLVAVKVHAMEILYHQHNRIEWVGEALVEELSKQIENQSAAYQSRARKILGKLKST